MLQYLHPCLLHAERDSSLVTLFGLACLLIVVVSVLTGKTIGSGKYSAIGGVVYREDEPGAFWVTLFLLGLLGMHTCYPLVVGCG